MNEPGFSRCSVGDCLEARRVGRVVLVRDSKLGRLSPLQAWTLDEWEFLCDSVSLDFPHEAADYQPDGSVLFGLHRHLDDNGLTFTAAEWSAFVAGVERGEFVFPPVDPGPAATTSDGGVAAGSVPGVAGEGHVRAATGAGALVPHEPAPVAAVPELEPQVSEVSS